MMAYVLDSSALLRYADDEPGAERVEEIISACAAIRVQVFLSAVQWGEVAGNLRKRFGAERQAHIMSVLLPSEAEIVPATAERAMRAVALKIENNLGYADAFAAELAMTGTERILVTADYGFKVLEDALRIEFLPLK